ncbi:hypothetical protein N7474_005163 [Penicillium riverlandense]|uniref:uncharacterized protein n=1 Tax=Penicillium riverlandense TaxID=1903569 RepID=UPI00254768C8|nr:uncharacterized protein N7474_005163 [Penicillium riverlandense]KAJ5819572.1 hypothetical protein N7474_005163 [Penicillium riverlandense]
MLLISLLLLAGLQLPISSASTLSPRIDNGVAKTPPMGWNTYNHYSCSPNESIVHSNAKALVDLGLAPLGYRYVTTDCGWTVLDRTSDGSLTWNHTLFPSGFPALGQFIHSLGLFFGVYEDAGIRSCQTTIPQAGSLYHEPHDAATFASWQVDSLKSGYPDADYTPSTSPRFRYANMTKALAAQNRSMLFQICDWGVDFPALWAPTLGNTWRISNDIIPDWRTIFRILNQAVPSTSFAGPGQWPDLDMLEVGNDVFTTPEEQTHFSMWAILKSPLTIGAALKDDLTAISDASLEVLSNKDVISFNQDSLAQSANLRRRWSEAGYEVWSGPLSEGRTVAALINWANEPRELSLNLPDIGLQHAKIVKNIWANETLSNVRTTYSATVDAHGVMLLELEDATEAGLYPSSLFATSKGHTTTFKNVYANTTSSNYTITISLSKSTGTSTKVILQSSSSSQRKQVNVPASKRSVSSTISLTAGSTNQISIDSLEPIDSIQITSPQGKYYPCTAFSLSGSAELEKCGAGFCHPVGSKIGYINATNTARAIIPANVLHSGTSSKYLELDYINNDIAFSTSWGWGSNSRNITVSVNDGTPVRLEVPLSGRHSELFGPGLGWWDSATLGLLVDGWKDGDNEVVVGNEGIIDGFTSWAADFVGLRLYD